MISQQTSVYFVIFITSSGLKYFVNYFTNSDCNTMDLLFRWHALCRSEVAHLDYMDHLDYMAHLDYTVHLD